MAFRAFFIFVIFLSPSTWAKSPLKSKKVALKKISYDAKTLVSFQGVLWSFSFISKDELLLSLRKGELYYYNLKTKEKKKLKGPKVNSKGQGGLLDVHYKAIGDESYVYLTFSKKHKKTVTTSLARGEYKNKSVLNLKTLFRAKVKGSGGRHFGSRLLFKDDFIYMTVGERGSRKYAQDLSLHNGKILRLTLDGNPASNNPFIKSKKALPEIFSYGHRNPQGIDLDPVSKKIYSVEFGPRGGDELNLIEKGKNYGWPIITYGKEYWGPKIGPTHKKGMTQPLTYWTPSISPSGMAFYYSGKIKEWNNNLFLAALGSRHLRRLEMKKGKVISQEKLFEDLDERIRHVRSGPDGYLYFSTDSGKLMRVIKRKLIKTSKN